MSARQIRVSAIMMWFEPRMEAKGLLCRSIQQSGGQGNKWRDNESFDFCFVVLMDGRVISPKPVMRILSRLAVRLRFSNEAVTR